jgi:hypothetical protein
MNFEIGQIFRGVYPPEAAEWCNSNGARMAPVAGGGFAIEKIQEPGEAELKEFKLKELECALDSTDWMAIREYDRKTQDPGYEMDGAVFAHREYLRQFNHGPGEWWAEPVLEFKTWKEQNR